MAEADIIDIARFSLKYMTLSEIDEEIEETGKSTDNRETPRLNIEDNSQTLRPFIEESKDDV